MLEKRLFASVWVSAVWSIVGFSAAARGHDSANLRPAGGSSARGEARIGSDEIRIRGDDLPGHLAISIRIAGADGGLREAFTATTESNGDFDVRASNGRLPLGAARASDFAGREVAVAAAAEGTVLLEGRFPGRSDSSEAGVGFSPLSPPAGAAFPGASGRIKTKASSGRHAIEVRVRGLADGAAYGVRITDAAGVSEAIGIITTSGGGNGALKVDTGDGGSMPFGASSVEALAGLPVSVDDAQGQAVLVGAVPSIGARLDDDDVGEVEVEFDLSRVAGADEPSIRGDVKFQSEIERDTVRVRLDRAAAGAEYLFRITEASETDPRQETLAVVTADGDGKAELERRGRPVLPLGAAAISELAGALVEVLRIEDEVSTLLLSGKVPAVPGSTPDNPPAPVERLNFVVALGQPETPVDRDAHGKVEFEEEDDEHEIEVEVQDLAPGADYRVELRAAGTAASATLFSGAADALGDIRSRTLFLGDEPLPLGVSSFRELDGAAIVLLDAAGAVVLDGMVRIGDGGGSGLAAAIEVAFSMVGDYDAAFLRGDTNRDAGVDLSDAVLTLNVLFRGSPPPRCLDSMDANDDGQVDVSDSVFALVYLFAGGLPPAYPGVSIAGFDASADGLFCADR
jgi:hypothetical protein